MLVPSAKLSRRQLLRLGGMGAAGLALPFASALPLPGSARALRRVSAAPLTPGMGPTGNLYLLFNSVPQGESGESDEFTTAANLRRLLGELRVPWGATVIALGTRSGTPADPYGLPGEMALHWREGSPWTGVVTDPTDASPVAWGEDDPCPFLMVGVLDDATAHRFRIFGQEGACLWNFYRDDTVRPLLGVGFHNAFSDRDGRLAETLYRSARGARRDPAGWATAGERDRLAGFLPLLRDDAVWDRFRSTWAVPLVKSSLLRYVRDRGWHGAAVVMRGAFESVVAFHQQAWNHRLPGEGDYELFTGGGGPLGFRYRSEYRSFAEPESAAWTMMGFLWNTEAQGAVPDVGRWMDDSDIFGHPFHVHGFRDDGSRLGHVLSACVGRGPIEIALYPLRFEQGNGAHAFDNDLRLLPETLRQTATELSVVLENDGESFARRVAVRLSDFFGVRKETVELPIVGPRERVRLRFTSSIGRDARAGYRDLRADHRKAFLEGGDGKANNRLAFDAALRWRWI